MPTSILITFLGLLTLFDLSVAITAYRTNRHQLDRQAAPMDVLIVDTLILHSIVHALALGAALLLILTGL